MAADDSGYSRLVQEGWSDEDDNSTANEKQTSGSAKADSSRDPSAPNYYQTIELLGDEQFCSNSIFGFEVNIHASQKSSLPALSTGSSKVKITTITNQSWDLTNRHGYLVASSNEYLAYVLEGRNGYVIRIINQLSTNRGLLKDFSGAITDVTFAHAGSDYLAAIDQGGNLYIWKLEEKEMEVKAQLVLHVARSSSVDASIEYRLVWCPYVTSGSDEVEYLFAVALGTNVEVWNLDTVLASKPALPLARSNCKDGVISLDDIHTDVILDLAISPDANVLATASKDGHVKFWSISSSNSNQHVCLHDWTPHGGDPVSRLMFCDNLLTSDPNAPFWRFLVTGANDNTEVKLWCAQTWKCLQTIRFLAAVDMGLDDLPSIKMCLDLSASYLLAADSKRTVLYVLQLYQDPELGQASFTSITDHLLTQSILSFVITGAVQPQPDDEPSNSDLSDEDDDEITLEKFDSRKNIAIIRLHCIQTKSVQELMVRFEPQDRLNMPPQQLLQIPELAELYGLSKTLDNQPLSLKSPSALISKTNEFPHPLPPAVAHIDASLITLPDTESSTSTASSQPLVNFTSGGASGELISKGLTLESSVDPPSLTTYISSPLSSLPTTNSNVSMTLPGPIGNFSYNSQKLLSPAEFVSSPPHSLSSFQKVTPSDFSSALPSVASSTAVAAPATPTSVAVHTSIAPPPILSAEDSSPEVTLESSSSSEDHEDDKVTPQDIVQSSFQDISETMDPDVNLSNISAEISLLISSVPVLQSEAAEDDSNLTSQYSQTSVADGLSPQQKSELLRIDGRVSQTSSDFASANDQESEVEEEFVKETPINVANNLVDTIPYSKPQSEVGSSQLFPSVLPDEAGQQNNQWTPQSFQKAVASQNSTEAMKAQSPSTVDVLAAANESTATVESSSAIESIVSRSSYTSAAADHGRASVNDVISASPRSSIVTLNTLSSATTVTTAGADVVDKDTSHSIDLSTTSVGSSSHSMNHQELASSVVAKEQYSVAQHSVGEQSLNELHQLVVEQQQNMNVLRQQIDRQQEEMMERIQQLMVKSFKHQENILVKNAETQQLTIERVLKEKQESDQLRHDQLIATLSQVVSQTVSGKLEKVMKSEMKQSVVPAVSRSLTSLQDNFSTVLQQKLTATDSALKEGVGKILKSKSFADSLGGAAAMALQGPLKAVYEQVFQSTILPQFDRSCQAMCQQINSCFQQGTRQYLEELQRHLDSHRHQSDASHGQLLQQLSKQLENTARIMDANNKMSTDTLATTLSTTLQNTVQQQINHSLDQLQSTVKDIIVSSVQSHPALVSLSDQLNLQAKDSNRKVKEEELLMMIQNKELNKAFEVALTATDLHLVLFVCKQVDADELFDVDPPCLTQPVLLSLIQHLSCNMSTDLDIKMRYLEHSILALNTSNEVTRSHMPGVLSGLCQQLQQAEELLNLTSPSTAKKLRRLRMVAERLAQPS